MAGCWLLVAGWLPVAGCGLLAVGCRLLVGPPRSGTTRYGTRGASRMAPAREPARRHEAPPQGLRVVFFFRFFFCSSAFFLSVFSFAFPDLLRRFRGRFRVGFRGRDSRGFCCPDLFPLLSHRVPPRTAKEKDLDSRKTTKYEIRNRRIRSGNAKEKTERKNGEPQKKIRRKKFRDRIAHPVKRCRNETSRREETTSKSRNGAGKRQPSATKPIAERCWKATTKTLK